MTWCCGVQSLRSLAGLHILRRHLENAHVSRKWLRNKLAKMRDSGHRTRHHKYVIVVTGCVLRDDLTAQFVYMSNSASQSVQRKCSI